MVKKNKNIILIAGVISTLIGIIMGVPSFLQSNYPLAIFATILIMVGLVLLAITFED